VWIDTPALVIFAYVDTIVVLSDKEAVDAPDKGLAESFLPTQAHDRVKPLRADRHSKAARQGLNTANPTVTRTTTGTVSLGRRQEQPYPPGSDSQEMGRQVPLPLPKLQPLPRQRVPTQTPVRGRARTQRAESSHPSQSVALGSVRQCPSSR
jgi:hypothetical protein